MVNINNVFTSDYLRAADLEEKPHLVTIKDAGMVTMQDNTQKILVTFNEFERGLLLNKTNAYNLSEYLGPDTDGWVGHQTVLFTAWVDFQGKSVEAIRVRKPKPQVAKPAPAKVAAEPEGPPRGHPAALDDHVPFEHQWK